VAEHPDLPVRPRGFDHVVAIHAWVNIQTGLGRLHFAERLGEVAENVEFLAVDDRRHQLVEAVETRVDVHTAAWGVELIEKRGDFLIGGVLFCLYSL